MRVSRFHLDTPLTPGELVGLPPEQARHAARVLRLRPGAALALFDGHGTEHLATVAAVDGGRVEVRVGEPVVASRESPFGIVLAQGLARGERMDTVVQKATELGVRAVQPLVTRRSEVRLEPRRAARREAHWRAVAVAACEQCGRATLPEIRPLRELAPWLGALDAEPHARAVLAPGAGRALADLDGVERGVCLLIGPEGGLDEDELAAAEAAGFVAVGIGPRTLRTETAALAAVALAQSRWGDLG